MFFRSIPSRASRWLFVAGFILMCCAYEYGRVLHLRPQPHHMFRQADCLGPTYNYYAVDANFFHPRMCNLHADHDTSGESAGEFPLIYWLMGLLWRVIGPSEFAYRLFGLLLHFVGSWALFRVGARLLRSEFWAGWVALLFFASPTVAYFTVSFLPDVPALDLALVGWWCLILYHDRKTSCWLFASLFFMALGTLLKVTAGMSLLALLGVLAVETLPFVHARLSWKVFPERGKAWLAFVGAIVLVLSWYGYADWYNTLHNAPFTSNSILPVWKMTVDDYRNAVTFAREVLLYEIFDTPVWLVLLAFLLLAVRASVRLPVQAVLLLGALLVGLVLYVLCWFPALNNHDYYFIDPLVVPMAVVLAGLWYLHRHQPRVLSSGWTKAAALVLLVYSTLFAAFDMQLRTRNGGPLSDADRPPLLHPGQLAHWEGAQYWNTEGFLDITPVDRALGITPEDRVLVAPDRSWQQDLYFMQQLGWSDYTMYLTDTLSIDRCIRNGARYFFLSSPEWEERPYMQRYLQRPLGRHKGIAIYDLRPLAPAP